LRAPGNCLLSFQRVGRACAHALPSEGIRVVINARSPEPLRKTAEDTER
jgi:NADP-dependent 3-hydroxy acid dehydrogenase YdfG